MSAGANRGPPQQVQQPAWQPRPRPLSLLHKLLAKDIRRDRSWLLQVGGVHGMGLGGTRWESEGIRRDRSWILQVERVHAGMGCEGKRGTGKEVGLLQVRVCGRRGVIGTLSWVYVHNTMSEKGVGGGKWRRALAVMGAWAPTHCA